MQALSARHAGLKVFQGGQAAACAGAHARTRLQGAGGFCAWQSRASSLHEAGTPLRERRLHTRQGVWLRADDQPDGPMESIEAGRQARATLRREVPRHEGRHSAGRAALADQSRQAIEQHPHLHTALLASSMLAGLEHSLPEILERQAPGIAHGLKLLALKPGDAVADFDPGDLSLPVRLALEGCKVTLLHSDLLTSARLYDEVVAYERGRPRGMPRQRPDGQPWLSTREYRQLARQAGWNLSVYPASRYWNQLAMQEPWRALLSRGRLAFQDEAEAVAEFKAAARLLARGGGLLFQMPHGAGEPQPANAGWTRRLLQMGQIEDAACSQGLRLRCAHITFHSPGVELGTLLEPRQVAPECSGWVDFHNVDAAAWDGWCELQRDTQIRHHPMTVEVSGLLERVT